MALGKPFYLAPCLSFPIYSYIMSINLTHLFLYANEIIMILNGILIIAIAVAMLY